MKKLTHLALALVFGLGSFAQEASSSDEVLFTIGDEEVRLAEFQRVYEKNQGIVGAEDQKSPEEYLEMFINFKLKVKEAEALGMDTLPSFKRELEGYRKQLAKPYLIDSKVSQQLIEEAYQRLQEEVHASHILIKLPDNPSPKDTVEALKKANKIREEYLKSGDFTALALKHSDDPSVKQNQGDLGYFTALYMVYPFETAAYTTPVGSISMPVRTSFGYHLVLVHDKRPARGKVQVAHIMVKASDQMAKEDRLTSKQKIDEIYTKLKNGAQFAEMAKMYSEDPASSKNGGVLPMFGINEYVEPFENAAFALENIGDISAPIQTMYGYHILQLIDKQGLRSFDQMRFELEGRIQRDSRSVLSKQVFINRLKKEYGFKEFLKERNDYYKLLDKSIYQGGWNPEVAKRNTATLFIVDGTRVRQPEFTEFIAKNQPKFQKKEPFELIVNRLYEQFVTEWLTAYENERLEEKYPEFKYLMQEYRDGILLFDLMGKKVWNKATQDTSGLKQFYEDNKQKYMWGERVDASVVSCASMKYAKKMKKAYEKGKNIEDLILKLNKNSQLNVAVERGIYAKGDHPQVDALEWATGAHEFNSSENGVQFVFIHQTMAPEPKKLVEARGVVIADYQAYLEQEWIKSLRQKFEVNINQEVLDKLD